MTDSTPTLQEYDKGDDTVELYTTSDGTRFEEYDKAVAYEENREELVKTMKEKQDAIEKAISDAEDFANEWGLRFSIDPAYGMGGNFIGIGNSWVDPDEYCEYVDGPREGNWMASSVSC